MGAYATPLSLTAHSLPTVADEDFNRYEEAMDLGLRRPALRVLTSAAVLVFVIQTLTASAKLLRPQDVLTLSY